MNKKIIYRAYSSFLYFLLAVYIIIFDGFETYYGQGFSQVIRYFKATRVCYIICTSEIVIAIYIARFDNINKLTENWEKTI